MEPTVRLAGFTFGPRSDCSPGLRRRRLNQQPSVVDDSSAVVVAVAVHDCLITSDHRHDMLLSMQNKTNRQGRFDVSHTTSPESTQCQ